MVESKVGGRELALLHARCMTRAVVVNHAVPSACIPWHDQCCVLYKAFLLEEGAKN